MKLCKKKLHQYDSSLKRCPECAKQTCSEWYETHKQQRLNSKRNWRNKELNEAKLLEQKWRKSNPDKVKGNKLVKYWPSLSWREALAEYNNLLKSQNHVCACCNQPETFVSRHTGKILDLAVDHCHVTGKVRGLLCSTCNLAEGMLKTYDKAQKLALYMQRFVV